MIGLVAGRSADPLSSNDRDVLIALVSGGLGLLTGISVAELGLRHSRELDERRAAREDLHRFTADKTAAYARLLSAANLARAAVWEVAHSTTQEKYQLASKLVDQMSAAHDTAALLASPEVYESAADYLEGMIEFFNRGEAVLDLDPAERRAAARPGGMWADAEKPATSLRRPLINAMRLELGFTPLADPSSAVDS